MAFSDEQLNQYDREGAVMIDSPFAVEELDRAEAAWDRIKASGDPPYADPDYVDIVQHPFFEEVAKKVLRANSVHLWWNIQPQMRPPWEGRSKSPR
jgi:hypothetical protein